MINCLIIIILNILLLSGTVVGCGSEMDEVKKKTENKKVSLTLWGSPESLDMLKEISDGFIEHYKNEADIEIFLGSEEEETLADSVKENPQMGADVFHFADDQIGLLINSNSLLPITLNTEKIIEDNGGKNSEAIQCVTKDNLIYAYPVSAGNGYFMYYNAAYFSDEDVKSLDKMLEIAEKNGKFITMDWSSGWYIYSFFGGAGLELSISDDKKTNICKWNSKDTKYKGVDVAKSMLNISSKKGFLNTDDFGFTEGVRKGTVIAGVNGPWNAKYVKSIWGENYRAVKLPTYTLNGEQVQMSSFIGYKLVGVNSKTDEPEWSMKLAEWISSYEGQMKRFEVTGEYPSNKKAANSPEVMSSQAAKAISEQMPFSICQNVASAFWSPTAAFGTIMASGNSDNLDLQKLLDELVEKVQQ